jgi:glutamine---fructose-6-phosphate transaminase (isomerizing)
MCGIFGILLRPNAQLPARTTEHLLRELYKLSESRGKESAGLHMYAPQSGNAWTVKGAQRATELLDAPELRQVLGEALPKLFDERGEAPTTPVALIAHSRLVTNGTAALPQNNQPVRWGSVSIIHNGIIVNVDELWREQSHLPRHAEVDTEVLAAMLAEDMAHSCDPVQATQRAFGRIRGAASVAWIHDRSSSVTLATNTGDLYFLSEPQRGLLVFASEQFILKNALARALPDLADPSRPLEWLQAGNGLSIDLASDAPAARFACGGQLEIGGELSRCLDRPATHHDSHRDSDRGPIVLTPRADESLLRYGEAAVGKLRRCSKCVLPETFPFIEFDAAGVCNYCRSYRPRYAHMHPTATRRSFIESLQKYRRAGGEPDVLVAFSGGRDSSYGLHLIKKEFGLTPVTFTYDWGMVTDLARRNVARICGQLGIQNILVSADLAKKRDNIRNNVSAWLRQPDLGMVPLFMAGDKHFFRVVNELKGQTGIRLDLWCANPLENTDFKAGLCGVQPDFAKKRVDYLSFGRKLQLAGYYASRFLHNPRYLNASLLDTFGAFMAYYVEPRRDFYFIFDHFIWDEREVNDVLLSQYDWELAPDSTSTWRIGDGTAPFYNYIYMTARGFTEFDTFRSNQIREGMMTRKEALEAILVENRPRAQSLRWYLETIELDFNSVINTINQLDTLGLHR